MVSFDERVRYGQNEKDIAYLIHGRLFNRHIDNAAELVECAVNDLFCHVFRGLKSPKRAAEVSFKPVGNSELRSVHFVTWGVIKRT